jgi:D-threo-aldose 1-dehydrogenase
VEVRERASRLESVCAAHGVPLAAAALQFPLAHPAVAAVIPGFASAAEVRTGVDHFLQPIPDEMWTELQHEGLIDRRAPTPPARMAAAVQ